MKMEIGYDDIALIEQRLNEAADFLTQGVAFHRIQEALRIMEKARYENDQRREQDALFSQRAAFARRYDRSDREQLARMSPNWDITPNRDRWP